ncbi:hypothetical protein SVIO_050680 [Streptomyces violaceusniger]|uniref:Uncharacterized protein n=1 Tax=Streptomyces violaceusniger TaxID=68280 RepID=A0A4D4KZR9_STRVO|nr:hypothetical protein SVIO_050680 [Streptomyces violaceusniger]
MHRQGEMSDSVDVDVLGDHIRMVYPGRLLQDHQLIRIAPESDETRTAIGAGCRNSVIAEESGHI